MKQGSCINDVKVKGKKISKLVKFLPFSLSLWPMGTWNIKADHRGKVTKGTGTAAHIHTKQSHICPWRITIRLLYASQLLTTFPSQLLFHKFLLLLESLKSFSMMGSSEWTSFGRVRGWGDRGCMRSREAHGREQGRGGCGRVMLGARAGGFEGKCRSKGGRKKS